MSKRLLLLSILILILLTACSPADMIGTAVPVTRTSSEIDGEFVGALPAQAQLALGTILLDRTNLAVDETQAYQLLPLWQSASTLTEDGATAEAELSAVTNRIQAALSTEQIAAISAMQLSQSTVDEMIAAGTLELAAGDFSGVAEISGDLANIDPTLLEIQGRDPAEELSNGLSVALAEEVIDLLETKVG